MVTSCKFLQVKDNTCVYSQRSLVLVNVKGYVEACLCLCASSQASLHYINQPYDMISVVFVSPVTSVDTQHGIQSVSSNNLMQ